jgi:hypothetical protein
MATTRRIGAKGDETEDLIKYAMLIGFSYFFVVKPVLASFGVDPADTATVNAQITADPTTNPFSPLFQPAVDYLNKQLGGSSGFANAQAFWDSIETDYKNGNTVDEYFHDIGSKAHQIFGDLSLINWTSDIVSVFNSLTDQVSCGLIAQYFYYELGADLINKLQDGLLSFSWLKGGLSNTTTAAIINHVNSLPVLSNL